MFNQPDLLFEPLSAVWVETSGIKIAPNSFAVGSRIWLNSEELRKRPSIKYKQCVDYDLGGCGKSRNDFNQFELLLRQFASI